MGSGAGELLDADLATLDPISLAELIRQLGRLEDRVKLKCAKAVQRFDALRGFELDGFGSLEGWLRHNLSMSGGAAGERADVARKLEALPATVAALEQGQIGFGDMAVIARASSSVTPESVPELERRTLEVAKEADPNQVQRFAEKVSCELNQEAFAANRRRAHELRGLELGLRPDGMYSIKGLLDQEAGVVVGRALDSVLGAYSRDDRRTPPQRRADALVELARSRLSGTQAFSPTNLTVTVDFKTVLESHGAETAMLEHLFAMPIEALRRHACDAVVTPIVVDQQRNPLYLGRQRRTVPPKVRKAIHQKFRTCAWPNCDRPLSSTEAHHLIPWIHGGGTDLDNLPPLCLFHHWLVHEGGWSIHWNSDKTRVIGTPPSLPRVRGPGSPAG